VNQKNLPPVIQIRSLSAKYGDIIALNDIDLDVHKGEIVGLIGPNGAGKSTLIKVLSGVMSPSAGEILINP